MRHVHFAVIALGILATASALALPPYGPGTPYDPDAYQPYQPCANDGDCPAGKQCVNMRQIWDSWRGGFVWSGECKFAVYGPPGYAPYAPGPGYAPPCPPVPQYDFQPCANTGDCPAGKLCYPMGQCFYPSC